MRYILIFMVLINFIFADIIGTNPQKTNEINIKQLFQSDNILLNNSNDLSGKSILSNLTDLSNKSSIIQTEKKDTSSVEKILDEAFKLLGIKYVWGAIGPDKFDCSGFVIYVIEKSLNIKLPRVSSDIAAYKQDKVGLKDLQRGDLIFFDTLKKGRVSHVGIYIGDNKFIHASSGSKTKKVTISEIDDYYKNTFKWAIRL